MKPKAMLETMKKATKPAPKPTALARYVGMRVASLAESRKEGASK